MKQKILLQYYKLLAFFAKKYLKRHKPIIIGINGSVGKTSCRTIIHQTLQKFLPNQKIYTSNKNFNGELGLPLSVFCKESRTPNIWEFIKTFFNFAFQASFAKKKYDIIILEYGIDRPWEMDFLLKIAKPDIWIFTALDAVHSEQFWDPNAIAQEEVKMPLNTKEIIFLNNDEPYTQQIINDITIDKITYQTTWTVTSRHSYESKDPNISFEHAKITPTKIWTIKSNFQINIQSHSYTIHTNQIGKINHGYIAVAIALTEILAYKLEIKLPFKSSDTIELEYTLIPWRLTLFSGIHNSILIDSSYNASPLSMRRLIDTTHQIKQSFTQQGQKKQIWLVLWDMRELGDFTEKEHRLLAGYCLGLADQIFLIGESMQKYFIDEWGKIGWDETTIQHFKNSKVLWSHLKKKLEKISPLWNKNNTDVSRDEECTYHPIILFKGSQNTIFLEEALKEVLQNPEDKKKLIRQSDFWMRKK